MLIPLAVVKLTFTSSVGVTAV